MTLKIFTLLGLFITTLCHAGEWTEPVNISKSGKASYPDFTIDSNNIIHCVWVHEIDWDSHTKIYYSKSEDMGENWSDPVDLSLNAYLKMGNPHICTDSKNNIYVSYDYNKKVYYDTHALITVFNGEIWSIPDTLSKGYPGIFMNRLAVDNNDRVYIFWHNFEAKLRYRYLENGKWSGVFTPYPDDYAYEIKKALPDEQNNLHISGMFRKEDQSVYANRAGYSKYDYKNDTWSDVKTFGTNYCRYGISGFDLDSELNPHVVWQQQINDSIPPEDGTFYSYYDGIDWAEPFPVGLELEGRYEEPIIALDDFNFPHIVIYKHRQWISHWDVLLYYNNLNTEGYYLIADSTDSVYVGTPELKYHNNNLFLIYSTGEEWEFKDLYFRKLDLSGTKIIHKKNQKPIGIRLQQNYPNPFNSRTIINYSLPQNSFIKIAVYDLKGRLVKQIINRYYEKGPGQVVWDGKNNSGIAVSSGIYLCRFEAGDFVQIRKMILLK